MKKYLVGLGLIGVIFFAAYPQKINADMDAPKIDKTKKALTAAPLSDQKILTRLYLENLWEAEVDYAAQQQAALQDTRDIAGDFLKDHTFLAKEMRSQAGRLLIQLSAAPAPYSSEEKRAVRQRGQFKKLKRLKGEAFDRRYRAVMAQNHKDTIDFIERQRTLLPKDSPVFSLLAIVLPKIKDHYDILVSTTVAEP